MNDGLEYTGSCLCGEVKIIATAAPEWVGHCHCPSCQKAAGAAFLTYAGYSVGTLHIAGESLTTFVSSPGVKRSFCNKCGSTIAFEGEAWPNEIHIALVLMDDAAKFQPERHVYTRTQQPWLKLADGLPRLHAFSENAD